MQQSIVFTLIWGARTIANDHIRFHVRGVNIVLSMLGLFFLVTWIALMFKAYYGNTMRQPIIGRIAERWAQSCSREPRGELAVDNSQ